MSQTQDFTARTAYAAFETPTASPGSPKPLRRLTLECPQTREIVRKSGALSHSRGHIGAYQSAPNSIEMNRIGEKNCTTFP